MPDLLEKMKQTIENYQMLPEGTSRVLLALSGGPDSMVMADLFCRLAKEARLFLWVAHLNHMLRGEESRQDAEFVRRWAEEHNLPYIISQRDVAQLRLPGESKAVAARRVRYEFLAECAEQAGAERIALAHTLSDQAETVLMRLLSGGGQGLRGIPPVRTPYIRPLIEIKREEILAYAQQFGVAYRIDSSNLSVEYLRNKIRLHLIPYLRNNYNPKVEEALARSAEILRAEHDYLAAVTEAWISANVQETAEAASLLVERLNQEPLAIRRRVINRLLTARGGREITFAHVEQVLALAASSRGTGELALPGLRVVRDYRYLRLESASGGAAKVEAAPPWVQLAIPGETILPEYSLIITASVHEGGPAELQRLQSAANRPPGMSAYYDLDQIELPLVVRTRLPGDSFQPFGLQGSKKLKDFLIDEKVSPGLRDRIALVTNSQGILWVVGLRSSELGKVTERTRRILSLAATPYGCQDMGGMI